MSKVSKQVRGRYEPDDEDWREHLDPTPVEIPTRLRLPQRQVDRVREIIRHEMSQRAQAEGWETFEEADDFELPGEDPVSPYEEVFEPVVVDSGSQHVAADKGVKDGAASGVEVGGKRKAADSVVVGRSGESVGKASGKADGAAGSSGGAGGADTRAEVDTE